MSQAGSALHFCTMLYHLVTYEIDIITLYWRVSPDLKMTCVGYPGHSRGLTTQASGFTLVRALCLPELSFPSPPPLFYLKSFISFFKGEDIQMSDVDYRRCHRWLLHHVYVLHPRGDPWLEQTWWWRRRRRCESGDLPSVPGSALTWQGPVESLKLLGLHLLACQKRGAWMAGSWWVVSGDSSPKYWLRFWCMKCYHFAKFADAFLYWLMLRTRFPSVSTNEASTLRNALTLGVLLERARQTGLVSANQPIHFQKNLFFFFFSLLFRYTACACGDL